MRKTRRFLTALICLVCPPSLKPPLLRLLGHRVANGARIGFSLILVGRLHMAAGSRIGFLNIVKTRRAVLRTGAYFGHMNVIRGHISLALADDAAIGNRNIVIREPWSREGSRPVLLSLGTWSKVTGGHYLNVSESIIVGEYSTIAGYGSQVWTHGFIHMDEGIDRAEIRGKILIGDNVYVGSQSCIGPGLQIGSKIAIGAHSSVATSLLDPGVYVSQPLRYIARSPHERLAALTKHSQDGRIHYRRNPKEPPPSARQSAEMADRQQ